MKTLQIAVVALVACFLASGCSPGTNGQAPPAAAATSTNRPDFKPTPDGEVGVARRAWRSPRARPSNVGGSILVSAFTCDQLTCECFGDEDCNDMVEQGVCMETPGPFGPVVAGECTGSGDSTRCWCWED